MPIKQTALKQYRRIVDSAAEALAKIPSPREGWITTHRKALGMPAADLARRVGVSRASIYQAQNNEATGSITLKQLEKIAKGMNGRLVYAIVPERGDVETVVAEQARRKVSARISNVRAHMALEDQSAGLETAEAIINRKIKEMVEKQPRHFWSD